MALCGLECRFLRIAQIAVGVCLAFSAIAVSASPAEAHGWRHNHRLAHYTRHIYARRQGGYEPPFSAIVVDANSGRTLYSVNENEQRHPASITKVMTLYLLFEQLDKGALTLQSQIPISQHAAAQEPSKLGLQPGDSITIDDAIKAIVTRSANDIAVAVAEAIGGDESRFAEMMTRKARELGMTRTQYVNASGLPNDQQLTTARDLTILGRAMEERFPRYFKYFSTHEFVYDGEVIGNHDHLLGKVEGVDGIKTGYTRASGFNLLTSVHRDGRSLIAVVMGGHTAASRDAMMETLIGDHIAEASTSHTATMIADAQAPEPAHVPLPPPTVAPAPRPAPAIVTEARYAPPARPAVAPLEEGDADDDEEDGAPRVAAVLPPARIAQRLAIAPRPFVAPVQPVAAAVPAQPALAPVARVAAAPSPAPVRMAAATPEALGWVKGPDPVKISERPQPAPKSAAAAPPPARAREVTQIARNDDARNDDAPRTGAHEGWIIQIGATDDAGKANDLLTRAREKERTALAAAKPLTEKVKRGDDVFYRARFAGLDSVTAEAACRSLKRSGFACFATRD